MGLLVESRNMPKKLKKKKMTKVKSKKKKKKATVLLDCSDSVI